MFRYLVSATTGFPTPMNVAGAKTQQIQVEVVVACEEACVIEDVALRGRPVPGQEGELEASLQAMDARVTGAQVDLHPFQLNAGQPIDEAGHVALRARYDAAASRCMGALGDSASNSPPSGYSAYVLEPACVEFYSGGHPGCINDRFLYVREGDATWTRTRLQA